MAFYEKQLREQTQSTYYEYPARTKDDAELWLGQNVQLIWEEKQIVGFQAVARDITERKRAEEVLKQSEQRFRELFENAPDAIFVEDFDGNVLDVNPAACRLHRTEYDQLVGRHVRSLVPPNQREGVMSVFDKNG